MGRQHRWTRALGRLTALCVMGWAAGAQAHVSIGSGPAFAGTTQEVTFTVGHGCDGVDTFSVRVEIPEAVTSVRAVDGGLGQAEVERDAADLVRAVTWTKAEADIHEGDPAFYRVTLRIKVPNAPFSTLHFPSRQVCRTPAGAETTVDWVGTGASGEAEGVEPAPTLMILPARQRGWNRYTVPVAIADLAATFQDALIVWRGNAAYSANPLTVEQIGRTEGVTALTALTAGDEIWVKY